VEEGVGARVKRGLRRTVDLASALQPKGVLDDVEDLPLAEPGRDDIGLR
jgi:hypothetical protein